MADLKAALISSWAAFKNGLLLKGARIKMEEPSMQGASDIAIHHATNPRNVGPLQDFDGHARVTGPCGDTMEFWIAVQDDKITGVSFITDGCGASSACGSMTTCLVDGKHLGEAMALEQQDILDAFGPFPEESEHCALLSANTFKAAIADYRERRKQVSAHSTGASGCESGCDSGGAGGCSSSGCGGESGGTVSKEQRDLKARLGRIRHKILVMSGKGGVGKSTVAVNLATALALSGKKVGLLDVDFHGPSIPAMVGLEEQRTFTDEDGLLPVELGDLKIMSLGFLLSSREDAVIWRGPMKITVIQQFLKDVVWGDLDYLIIDSPPGTGDEPLSVCQMIEDLDGAVIVTTPQRVAVNDARRSITFCRQAHVRVLGVIENMSGFACPSCGEITPILKTGGGQEVAEEMRVPFLGAVPMDPQIVEACDTGRSFIHHYAGTPTAEAMQKIIRPLQALSEQKPIAVEQPATSHKENGTMKVAIPLANGKLSMHFGHCEQFALIEVDLEKKEIMGREDLTPPPHEPGLLPRWLAERHAKLIIAGGMGQRAQSLFQEQGIEVVIGAAAKPPETLIAHYLSNTLVTGANTCDH